MSDDGHLKDNSIASVGRWNRLSACISQSGNLINSHRPITTVAGGFFVIAFVL